MPASRKDIRGLKEIRTLSRRLDRTDAGYKVYMRLSALEREKVRLINERDSTIRRLKALEARLLQIEDEELSLAGQVPIGRDIASDDAEPAEDAEAQDEDPGNGDRPRTFRLRY